MRHAYLIAPLLALSSLVSPLTAGDWLELDEAVAIVPSSGAVIVAGADGGLKAIDAASGQLLWESDLAALPVALFAGRVVVRLEPDRPGRLPLAILSSLDGGVEERLDLDLPAEVWARLDEGLEEELTVRTGVGPVGELHLDWSYRRRPAQGAAVAKGPETFVASGSFDLSWSGGGAATVGRGPRPPAVLETSAIELPAERRLPEPGRQFYSLDQTAVLASQRSAAADGVVSAVPSYRWKISSADGRALASFDAPTSYSPFWVAADVVVHLLPGVGRRVDERWVEDPRAVRAVDPASGREMWREAIRDRSYRGPFPP